MNSAARVPAQEPGFLQRQSEWVQGGPRGFVQWEFAFLRRVRPSHARAPGEEALMQAGPPPGSCAPRTLQAACRAPEPEGFEEETQDARTQPFCPSALLFRNGTKKASPWSSFPRQSRPGLGSYLVVGDRFLLSQWTASKKAAFQNLSVCLQDRQDGNTVGHRPMLFSC